MSVCNAPINTTPVSNRRETRWPSQVRPPRRTIKSNFAWTACDDQKRDFVSLKLDAPDFVCSINRVCKCDVRSPATVPHPVIPTTGRVQRCARCSRSKPAHRATFACVRPSMCHNRCVFFVEVAYNDRLPPPRLPPPIGWSSTSYYYYGISIHMT